jgi:hypothetical protein
MGLLNPTPQQIHRRQVILAALMLIGIPILNALLQKYGIPPIAIPAQTVQQVATPLEQSAIEDVTPTNVKLCTFNEHETLPINLDRGPLRRLVKSRFARERGILHRIHERRHPSASAACPSYVPVPAVEAPAKLTRGGGIWSGCQAQCCP